MFFTAPQPRYRAVRTLAPQPAPPGIYASRYSLALAAHICGRLAAGESLRGICREDATMPTEKTVWNWRRAHPEFERAYGQAVMAARRRALADQDRRDAARRAAVAAGLHAPSGRVAWNRGRSRCSPEALGRIFAGLEEGRSLQEVCRDPGMPCVATVYNWMRAEPELRARYRAARDRWLTYAVERSMAEAGLTWDGGFRTSMRRVREAEGAALRRSAQLAPKRYADGIYGPKPPVSYENMALESPGVAARASQASSVDAVRPSGPRGGGAASRRRRRSPGS